MDLCTSPKCNSQGSRWAPVPLSTAHRIGRRGKRGALAASSPLRRTGLRPMNSFPRALKFPERGPSWKGNLMRFQRFHAFCPCICPAKLTSQSHLERAMSARQWSRHYKCDNGVARPSPKISTIQAQQSPRHSTWKHFKSESTPKKIYNVLTMQKTAHICICHKNHPSKHSFPNPRPRRIPAYAFQHLLNTAGEPGPET